MCWSAEGSLATGSLGMILAALAWYYKTVDPVIWIFAVTYTSMQFVEYFLWKNLNNPAGNEFWSKVGALNIMIQPVILAFLIKKPELRNKIIGAYLLAMLVGNYFNPLVFKTTVGENGHLNWHWVFDHKTLWGPLWVIAFFTPMIITKHWGLFGFSFILAATSFYFNVKFGTASSYWCWLAVSLWLAALARLV